MNGSGRNNRLRELGSKAEEQQPRKTEIFGAEEKQRWKRANGRIETR